MGYRLEGKNVTWGNQISKPFGAALLAAASLAIVLATA
jgi:hypothetical protein